MKIIKKLHGFATGRNFNLAFYAFFAGFFGEQAFQYLHKGHIGWGLLLLTFSIYDLTCFVLWLTKSKIKVSVKVTKKESV